LAESNERNQTKEKSSPLTCYFWTRDDFLPTVECTSAQANILLALAGYANPDGTSSRPGRLKLMLTTKYDRDTIREAINFWLSHPSHVLLRTFKGNGKTHASVYRIVMPDDGQPKGADADPKRAEQTPLKDGQRGGVDAPSDPKGADKGRERGGKGADSPPIPYTEVPSTDNSKSSSQESASSSDGSASGDDELKFEKAKAKILAEYLGPKDECAAALDLIRERVKTNGNQPVRYWPTYLEKSLREFLPTDWNVVRTRLARAAEVKRLSSPEARAKAQHLYKTATDHNWIKDEFDDLLFREFNLTIPPTIESIARLSELDYQTALTRFQQPPETICKECGQRGCEHLRAERERMLASVRQRFREMQSKSHE
jgi:hypothetical protein